MNREYSLSPWPRSHVCHIICWVRTNIPGCWRKTTSGKWRIQNTERETAERMRAGRICHKLYAILCDLLILNLAQCSAAPFRFPATFVSSEFFFISLHFAVIRMVRSHWMIICGVNEKKSWRNAARQNECGEQLQISRKEICSVNWNEDEVSNGNCCWFGWTVSNVKRTMELCGWAMLVDCCILIYYAIIYQTVRRNDISFLRPHSPSTVNVLCHVDFIEVDFYYYWPN